MKYNPESFWPTWEDSKKKAVERVAKLLDTPLATDIEINIICTEGDFIRISYKIGEPIIVGELINDKTN